MLLLKHTQGGWSSRQLQKRCATFGFVPLYSPGSASQSATITLHSSQNIKVAAMAVLIWHIVKYHSSKPRTSRIYTQDVSSAYHTDLSSPQRSTRRWYSCRVLKTSEGKTLSLASLAGKPLVLFFYPKAATPGCTKEVRGIWAGVGRQGWVWQAGYPKACTPESTGADSSRYETTE